MNEIIQRQPHKATFEGRHNSSKARVLLSLYEIMFTHGVNKGFNAGEIHLLSGVPINTINASLPKWHRWHYVARRAQVNGNGKPAFFYYLGARGKHFVEERIPPDKLKRYSEEIKAFRKERGVKLSITHSKIEDSTIEEEDDNEYDFI